MTLRERIASAPVEDLPTIAAELAEAQTALALRVAGARPASPTVDDEELLTMDEVASELRIGDWRARELGRRGVIPTVTVGERGVRVRRGALREYIRRNERGAMMPRGR